MGKASSSKRAPSHTPRPAIAEQELFELSKKDFEAVLTGEQVLDYESTENELWGTKRRIAMLSLARSKEQLIGGFESGDSIDSLFDMIESINDWSDHIKGHIEMADMAVARLITVASAIICRNQESK